MFTLFAFGLTWASRQCKIYLLSHWSIDLLPYLPIEPLIYRSTTLFTYWAIDLSIYYPIEPLIYRSTTLLSHWSIDLLPYWSIDLSIYYPILVHNCFFIYTRRTNIDTFGSYNTHNFCHKCLFQKTNCTSLLGFVCLFPIYNPKLSMKDQKWTFDQLLYTT